MVLIGIFDFCGIAFAWAIIYYYNRVTDQRILISEHAGTIDMV
jgi:hypothetical protein